MESMEFDVVIVGAGPSGLSAAIKVKQLNPELNVVILEKGSEVGAHILSGAVIEPRALDELIPNWRELEHPLKQPVLKDHTQWLFNNGKMNIPDFLVPSSLHNQGNYIASLGNLCRWLGEHAESLGVEIFPGFAAQSMVFDDQNQVIGVQTGEMGVAETGEHKDSYTEAMQLLAPVTLLCEGCHGHLGKQVIKHFDLGKNSSPQHYGLGIKELWKVPKDQHHPGQVLHAMGWPLNQNGATGGAFLYHLEDQQVAVGLITDLNYDNPYLSPYDEFQTLKHHPSFKTVLNGGERIAYGARAIAKGGPQSLPKMAFPGGLLLGCDAGTLNFAKIKGTHTAMKSGLVGAELIVKGYKENKLAQYLATFDRQFESSWAFKELHQQRNSGPAIHKFGQFLGAAYSFIDLKLFRGLLPWTLKDNHSDATQLKPLSQASKINYRKPDGKLSFDKLSSVFISNTNHEEDQPCHLKLSDPKIPLDQNLVEFGEPAQRYCPAGVYEIIETDGKQRFQINSQNCLHCKTCDIKDPAQNITWVTPEGGGGPNYPNM